MRAWLKLLFPLMIWGLHFTGLYLTIEFLPDRTVSATLLLTALCIAALLAFWRLPHESEALTHTAVRHGTLLSLTAIAAQCMPLIAHT